MSNPIKLAFSNVAWKRTLLLSAFVGLLGTMSADKDALNNNALAYFIGYGGGIALMSAATTAACSKQRQSV